MAKIPQSAFNPTMCKNKNAQNISWIERINAQPNLINFMLKLNANGIAKINANVIPQIANVIVFNIEILYCHKIEKSGFINPFPIRESSFHGFNVIISISANKKAIPAKRK